MLLTTSAETIPIRHLKLKFSFIVFVTLVSCRFWSFNGIPDRIYDMLEVLVSFILILILVFDLKRSHLAKARFSNNVILFICLPFLSGISAAIFHNQELYLSLLMLKAINIWLLYFVLHIYNVPIKWLINFMIVMGVSWVLLTVIQQFTYPTFYFYTRDDSEGSLLRAGIYRFFLEPKNYCLFLILYFYNKFLFSLKTKHILFALFGLVGYYYLGARQYIAVAMLLIVLASLMQTGKIRVYALLFICLLIGTLLAFKEILFGSYIEMTAEQLQDDDDVRLLAVQYYLFDYWPHWLTVIFGNGLFHYNASYGQEMRYINTYLGLYREDIGILGAFNYFGLLYVLNIVHLNIKGLRKKYYTKETAFLKLFFINFILLIFLSHEYAFPSSIAFLCFIFYFVDQSYLKNKALTKYPI